MSRHKLLAVGGERYAADEREAATTKGSPSRLSVGPPAKPSCTPTVRAPPQTALLSRQRTSDGQRVVPGSVELCF